jgi:hypothetical protein
MELEEDTDNSALQQVSSAQAKKGLSAEKSKSPSKPTKGTKEPAVPTAKKALKVLDTMPKTNDLKVFPALPTVTGEYKIPKKTLDYPSFSNKGKKPADETLWWGSKQLPGTRYSVSLDSCTGYHYHLVRKHSNTFLENALAALDTVSKKWATKEMQGMF